MTGSGRSTRMGPWLMPEASWNGLVWLSRTSSVAERPSVILARNRGEVLEFCDDFGSVARGTDAEADDVDLLFEARPDTPFFDLIALRMRLEDLLRARFGCVTLADSIRSAMLRC